MKQIAHLPNGALRYEGLMTPAVRAVRVDGNDLLRVLVPEIALADSPAALWSEMRGFCLQLGCPAMDVVNFAGGAGPAAAAFLLPSSRDDLRRDLAATAGRAVLIDSQTLAVPGFGPLGLEAALVVRLAVLECAEPDWAGQLCIAFQLAYARYRQLAPRAQDVALSEREREIIFWVTRGKSNSVIGSILGISSSTVDTYMRRIFRKLDVADRTSAAMRAVAIGAVG